jgi:hypothetical protein
MGERGLSKWINKELFGEFQKQKKEEADAPSQSGLRRSNLVWETPQKGTSEKPKVYEGRFLPDPKGNFYKKYSYHMFQSGEKWVFIFCPKTKGFENYCPVCSVTSKLYQGSPADKRMAYTYKRKEKFVSNFYIVNDPRDPERDEENRVNNTVKLYEFPSKVEMKLKEEITDVKNGYGYRIFDPGEDGHNFILKVLATKKDPNGKVWPDYSSSTFSRNSEALGSESEIEKIMKQCVDLSDYINNLGVTEEKIEEVLKNEMVWDLIEDEWNKVRGLSEERNETSNDSEPDDSEPDDIDDSIWDKKEEQKEDAEFKDEDMDDEALLDELSKM